MATINSLTNLAIPTGDENVVVQNNENNYKMAYKPNLVMRETLETQSSMAAAITTMLNNIRTRYGDAVGYHIQYQASIPNWPNGIFGTIDTVQGGSYIIWYGIVLSQTYGVVAFTRYDTIGGATGTLRTSELGSNLA